jgi:hypothetical protein
LDLSGEIVAGDGVLLPLGLVWALVVAYCDESPFRGKLGELLEERLAGHP